VRLGPALNADAEQILQNNGNRYTLRLELSFSEGDPCSPFLYPIRIAVVSAKNHKRQRRKRQSVTAKREKSQTPKVLTPILTLPNLT